MTFRAADLKETTHQALANLKAYINPAAKEAYALGAKTTRQLQTAYPAIAHDVSDAAYKTVKQSKQALKLVSNRASDLASNVGSAARSAEKNLLKVGFIYMIYRLFITDDHVVKAANTLKANITRKPVESAAIALGIGYVLGKIIRLR